MQLLERAIQLGRTNHLASMVSRAPLRRLRDKLQLHPARVLSPRQMTPQSLPTGRLHEDKELLRKIDQYTRAFVTFKEFNNSHKKLLQYYRGHYFHDTPVTCHGVDNKYFVGVTHGISTFSCTVICTFVDH